MSSVFVERETLVLVEVERRVEILTEARQGPPGPPGPIATGTFPSADPGNTASIGADGGFFAPHPQLASAQW